MDVGVSFDILSIDRMNEGVGGGEYGRAAAECEGLLAPDIRPADCCLSTLDVAGTPARSEDTASGPWMDRRSRGLAAGSTEVSFIIFGGRTRSGNSGVLLADVWVARLRPRGGGEVPTFDVVWEQQDISGYAFTRVHHRMAFENDTLHVFGGYSTAIANGRMYALVYNDLVEMVRVGSAGQAPACSHIPPLTTLPIARFTFLK